MDTRRSVWRAAEDGRKPARLAQENARARVVATDLAARMVELASARGVAAQVGDIAELPFAAEQ